MEDATWREALVEAEAKADADAVTVAEHKADEDVEADTDAARRAEMVCCRVVAAFLQSLRRVSTCGRVAWTKRKEGKRGSVTMRLWPCLRICL